MLDEKLAPSDDSHQSNDNNSGEERDEPAATSALALDGISKCYFHVDDNVLATISRNEN
jgi:hypothetical protein